MSYSNIELKPVSELLDMSFFIPSYQRGYRWTESQITALLKDIWEFDKSRDGDFYCLQPLVVKFDKNKWRVIDGQQRLTTIYLILKSLGNEKPFELKYERDSYIEDLNKYKDVCSDNIEIFHLTMSKVIINRWLNNDKKLNDEQQNLLKEKLLNQTSFIFYDVGRIDDNAEHDLFNNLNSGKIALTNAELIKALFLNKVGYEDVIHREVEQRLLADEFDKIESTLRQDEFWYFLAGNVEKPSSCINLLFNLMLETDNKAKAYSKNEKFRTFFYFNDKINCDDKNKTYKKSKEIWEKVRHTFHITEGWFNDSAMYNLIGFQRAANGGASLSDIFKIFQKADSKSMFKKSLIKACKKLIDYPDFIRLRYDEDKDRVFNLLLLFNIATLNKKTQEHVKFSFANFHKYKWDVEHISPQNPKEVDIKKLNKNNYNHIFDDLLKKIENEENYENELKKFFAIDDELMQIGNLTLLTSHDNRGIGNRFFFEKRQKLQEYYQNGSFIPTCSMNVFMKFYSTNINQMDFWDNDDRKNYTDVIEVTIKDFFAEDEKNGQE